MQCWTLQTILTKIKQCIDNLNNGTMVPHEHGENNNNTNTNNTSVSDWWHLT